MIEKFTNTNIKNIRTDIEKALSELESIGLNTRIGKILYSDTNFSCKLECNLIGSRLKEEKDYDNSKIRLGLPARNSVIRMDNQDFTIEGLNTRASKNKILISRNLDGKKFVTTINSVLKYTI